MFKEIGHVALKVKNYPEIKEFYKKQMGVEQKFRMMNPEGEERIGYFGLPDGHFIELFPRQAARPHGFVGENIRENRSYQYAQLAAEHTAETVLMGDVENNEWVVNSGKEKKVQGLYGVTYYCKKYKEMVEFYKEILQLELSVQEEKRTRFLLPSGQFVDLMDQTYRADNNTQDRAFHHIALLTDDILAASDWMESHGIKLSHGSNKLNPVYTRPFREICKKGSDGSYAFYFSDPEENDIEAMQYTEGSLQIQP